MLFICCYSCFIPKTAIGRALRTYVRRYNQNKRLARFCDLAISMVILCDYVRLYIPKNSRQKTESTLDWPGAANIHVPDARQVPGASQRAQLPGSIGRASGGQVLDVLCPAYYGGRADPMVSWPMTKL